jgi:GxxExxY protein
MIRPIKQVAKYVYDTLGAGHEEAIYRDAMSVELQDRGYTVKTEAPISIRYTTKKGREMIVGSILRYD